MLFEVNLKILAVYPGLNPVFDDDAFVLASLVAMGCHVKVITSRMSMLKSHELCAGFENFKGVEIYRPYSHPDDLMKNPDAMQGELIRMFDEFSPDILFLNSFRSLSIGRLLQSRRRTPSLLRLETADPLSLLQRRYYLGLRPLGRVLGRAKWRHTATSVDAMMTNDPADQPNLAQLGARGRHAYYAAHCARQPGGVHVAKQRNRGEMIYIGSMIRHKNCSVWLNTIPALFENTPVEQFTVIGSGPYQYIVDILKKRFGNRIQYISGVPRQEALERLSGAYFAYTESDSGWGFLCDAWAVGTPILCPQSTFGIVADKTGLMPKGTQALVEKIRVLYSDESLYHSLQEAGIKRLQNEHSPEVVSLQYLSIFRKTLLSGNGSK